MSPRASRWFALSTGLALVVAAIDAAVALDIRALLEASDDTRALAAPLAVLVALVVARGLAQLVVASSSHLGREELARTLRKRALEWLLAGSGARTAATSTSLQLVELHPRAVAHAQLRAGVRSYGAQAVLLAVATVLVAPRVAPWILVLLGLVAGLVGLLGRAIHRRAAAIVPAQRAFLADVTRITRTLPLVRALRLEQEELDRVGERVDAHAHAARRSAALVALAGALPTLLGAPVLAVALGAALAAGMDAPSAVAFVLLLVRLVLVGAALSSTWSAARASAPAHSTVMRDLGSAPTSTARPVGPRADELDRTDPPELVLDGVRLDRESGGVLARDVSARVLPGERLAIVGPSGAGKTTLLEAILGLRSPTTGSITLDGLVPAEYFARHAHRLGFVGPEPFLFEGTIRENLAGSRRGDVSDRDLRDALERAAVWDTVARLPRGLDEKLGEDGAPLSSGERQRLALARALLARPALLVLDEPTAHVDPATETEIMRALDELRGRTTCVMVVHREELVSGADHVLRMSAPMLAEIASSAYETR